MDLVQLINEVSVTWIRKEITGGDLFTFKGRGYLQFLCEDHLTSNSMTKDMREGLAAIATLARNIFPFIIIICLPLIFLQIMLSLLS